MNVTSDSQNPVRIRVEGNSVYLPVGEFEAGENVVVTGGPTGQLLIYAFDAWDEIEKRLRASNKDDMFANVLLRMMIYFSEDSVVENDGALKVSADLLQRSPIDTEAFYARIGRGVQVWALNSTSFICRRPDLI